jgi:hypothetical protein
VPAKFAPGIYTLKNVITSGELSGECTTEFEVLSSGEFVGKCSAK